MRALLISAAVLASTAANAGWFGLTEDYPFKAPGADRTAFIYEATRSCVDKTPVNNAFRLTNTQVLYVCDCKAGMIADSMTKTEWGYILKNNNTAPASLAPKQVEAEAQCLRDMIEQGVR